MLVLGIETSSALSSVALWDEDGARAEAEVARGRGHVEFLVPAIERLLARAGVTLADLTAVAVDIGPGSFTSMRVGITTAKTIAATRGIPAVGVVSLDVLAHGRTGRLCACIDARRGEIYAATYDDGARIDDPALWDPLALAEHAPDATFVGDGARLVSAAGIDALPHADTVCAIALETLARGGGADPDIIEPLYVRRTDAEIKWEQRGVTIERPSRVKIPGNR